MVENVYISYFYNLTAMLHNYNSFRLFLYKSMKNISKIWYKFKEEK